MKSSRRRDDRRINNSRFKRLLETGERSSTRGFLDSCLSSGCIGFDHRSHHSPADAVGDACDVVGAHQARTHDGDA